MKKILVFLLAFLVLFTVLGCSSGGSGGGGGIVDKDTSSDGKNPSDDKYTPDDISTPLPTGLDQAVAELVTGIKIGWNLGNTFDANPGLPKNASVSDLEKAWVGVVTTQANITAIKNAGFNSIRIPVSWTKCADSNYTIRKDWMDRIKEVVNYAVKNDMYIILNTHHDENVFKFKDADKAEGLKAFKIIWGQIAENFKDYNEKLIFEGLNEPRTIGSPAEWNGGTPEEQANLNEYYKAFVDVVRATGGNNANRFLLINPYGASGVSSAMNALVIPEDTATNRIIVSFHAYSPYNFALNKAKTYNTWSESNSSDKTAITGAMDAYKAKFIDKGIPVLIGEFGAMHKDNTAARMAWAKFYVREAKKRGIPCFWWDNHIFSGDGELFGLLKRSDNTFPFKGIVDALMDGVK